MKLLGRRVAAFAALTQASLVVILNTTTAKGVAALIPIRGCFGCLRADKPARTAVKDVRGSWSGPSYVFAPVPALPYTEAKQALKVLSSIEKDLNPSNQDASSSAHPADKIATLLQDDSDRMENARGVLKVMTDYLQQMLKKRPVEEQKNLEFIHNVSKAYARALNIFREEFRLTSHLAQAIKNMPPLEPPSPKTLGVIWQSYEEHRASVEAAQQWLKDNEKQVREVLPRGSTSELENVYKSKLKPVSSLQHKAGPSRS